MAGKISKDELNKRIETIKLNYHEIDIDLSTYKSFSSKIKAIDKDYGEWWPTLKNLYFKGVKHPKRRIDEQIIRQTIPIDVIKKQIFEKWQDQITIYEETYISSSVKAKFNDKTYGDFYSTPNRIIQGMAYYKIANKKIRSQRKKI